MSYQILVEPAILKETSRPHKNISNAPGFNSQMCPLKGKKGFADPIEAGTVARPTSLDRGLPHGLIIFYILKVVLKAQITAKDKARVSWKAQHTR